MIPPPPEVVVIVCAHNAARTIERTIRSILTQTSPEFQLLVVDDGSTDSTPEILRRLQDFPRHIRFNILSLPRQVGKASALIEAINYIPAYAYMFCDADDEMLPDAISLMYAKAIETDADIIMAPYIEVRPGRHNRLAVPRSDIRSLNDMPLDTVHFSLCNKLITARALHTAMPYPGIDRWEDLAVVARLMAQGFRLQQISTPIFRYYINPSTTSLSHSPKQQTLADRLAIADRLIQWFDSHPLYADAYREFILHLKYCARIKLARRPGRDLRRWRNTYPEINRHILTLRHIPLHYRLLSAAALLLP